MCPWYHGVGLLDSGHRLRREGQHALEVSERVPENGA